MACLLNKLGAEFVEGEISIGMLYQEGLTLFFLFLNGIKSDCFINTIDTVIPNHLNS